jgi:hypothetical protein
MKQSVAAVALAIFTLIPCPAASISGVWVNDGGDKVTRDELRIANNTQNLTGSTRNSVWNGSKITVFGGRNETVSFNLTLEAAKATASNVSVQFNVLSGPNNWKIRTSGTDPTNFVNRPIELFYERYVQIQGASFFGYQFENSQIPRRFQSASGNWIDRPDHDKWYPDALVPIELVKTFTIQQGQNQSIWCDIFIPKRAPAGLYKGSVKIYENGALSRTIPVELTVKPFALPDQPTAKTMLYLDNTDIEWRYVTGHGGYAQWDQPGGRKIQAVMDKYYQLLHRHKISAIGENECPPNDEPCDSSVSRLTGSLYTPLNGYDGVGLGTPNGVFSIGSYGTWGGATWDHPSWKNNQVLMNQHLDGYANWFQSNAPTTDVILYLQDEPAQPDWEQVETWSKWMGQNPGPGKNILSFSTVSSVFSMTGMPSLQVPASTAGVGNCPLSQLSCNNSTVMSQAKMNYSLGRKKFWLYNDGRPGVGTFDTESDGTDPRTIGIAQYKMGVDRWYYWEANTSADFDTFSTATSWGTRNHFDAQRGMWGDDAPTNGNGLLLYPGTDVGHTANSYGMLGPIASIRLKNWRRGIQDADYFAMAAKLNPTATQAILQNLYPKALWENTVTDPNWPITPISFPSDPMYFETARAQLADIIMGRTPPVSAPRPMPTPMPIPARSGVTATPTFGFGYSRAYCEANPKASMCAK